MVRTFEHGGVRSAQYRREAPLCSLSEFEDEPACTPDLRVFLGEEICATLEADDIEGVLDLHQSAMEEVPLRRGAAHAEEKQEMLNGFIADVGGRILR